MRKSFYVIALALLCGVCPLLGQVSTEGKDFWVALTYATGPDLTWDQHNPYIAISAKKACSVTVSNPNTGYTTTRQVQADSWLEIKDIPLSEWFPMNGTSEMAAASVTERSFTTGLRVTATENVSVFAANRLEFSFDAAIILPSGILQDEYIVQDFPPYDHANKTSWATFCVLATENNTKVKITPTSATLGGKAANTEFTVTLNAGQVYYVLGQEKKALSGSYIKSDKPVAVFNGDVCTDVPNCHISARDNLYEQSMPVTYWGNQFVVTRSMGKDANFVRITASEDATQVFMDGHLLTTLNSRETYMFEMSEGVSAERAKKYEDEGLPIPDTYSGYAHYISTSCPCAVYGYDVGQDYYLKKGTVPSEVIENQEGDPSMVWISPLEQKISKITFGVCATDKTVAHYLNVVVLTTAVNTVTLSSANRPSVPLTFSPVPGNTKYSYARTLLCNTTSANVDKVYTLQCPTGFVAHVYGLGKTESYAYSVGSSAVKRAINMEGITFTDGAFAEEKFCINTTLEFDAQVGTDVIDKVDWDFGDGVTQLNGPAQTSHQYETRGWYDVYAKVYAHKDCPETQYPPEGVRFSFYVDRPDTIRHETSKCVAWDDPITTDTISDTILYNCDSVVITSTFIRRASKPSEVDLRGRDSLQLFGKWYYQTQDVSITHTNQQQCDSVVTYHITIVYCLDIEVPKDVNPECDGGTSILIDFNHHKGEIDQAQFIATIDGQKKTFPLTVSSDYKYFLLDVSTINPGAVIGEIKVHDPICDQTLTYPITVFVRLPNSILHQKYDNVVGVTLESIKQYNFQGYQWKIDGTLVPNKTESIYYQDNGFSKGQYIEVLVLLPNGKWIQSCKLNLVAQEDINNPFRPAEQTEAQKVMSRGNLYIQIGDQLYNTLGERVY